MSESWVSGSSFAQRTPDSGVEMYVPVGEVTVRVIAFTAEQAASLRKWLRETERQAGEAAAT
jgi:hypothetical protein